MTVRQIIQEIDALSPEDWKEVAAHLSSDHRATESLEASSDVKYLSRDEAKPLIHEILTTHSELFQKLAQ